MHIPDSAISPVTSMLTGTAMVPVWYMAGRRLRETLATRQVPLLAIGAAFCFTIMMFNIPAPGGTTVHPIGSVLLAVLLGPWAAVIGVTVALVIQALFFADGGVFAAGANCFAMAFAMPFCGYLVYRLLAGRAPMDSPRRALAAGIGAYLGLNVAALLVAVMLGVQPAFYRGPDGRALYFPFGLSITIPAIMAAHLTIAGVAEAVVTTLAVRYLQAARIPLHGSMGAGEQGGGSAPAPSAPNERRELLWIGLGALTALSPLGLLATGDAWGEWSAEDLAKQAGYLPQKLAVVEEHGWKGFSLLPDYLSDRGPLFYVLAAVAGILVIVVLLLLAGRLLARRSGADSASPEDAPPSPGGSSLRPGEVPSWMLSQKEEETESKGGDRSLSAGAWARGGQSQVHTPMLHRGFSEKTLTGIAEGMQETVFLERWARQDGLLQRLDPRVKTVVLLGFIVVTAFLHRALPLLSLGALAMALAVLSRLPCGLLLQRVWLTVPLFVGAVTLPAALNVVTPGPALLVLWREPYLAVTTPGLLAAGLLTLRVGVAVSFVALLTLTTRWHDLLGGLRVLWVPKLFIIVLAMTYRYLAVLMQAASEMFVARKSRTVGRTTVAEDRRFLGGAIGALFGKTLALTEEVHAAMLSRGWTGEARTLRPLRLEAADLLWLGAMLLCAALAVGGEIFG